MKLRLASSRKLARTGQRSRGSRGSLGGVGLALGIVASGGLAWFLWRSANATEGADFDADRVVVVEARDVINSVNATGRVEPLARVAVMSRASGIIEQLLADEGDAVSAGQVLAELDREQLQAQWEQDRADRLASEARLAAARARLAEASVRIDDPEPEYLQREVARLEELHAQGNVSIRELDEARRTLANAQFRVDLVKATIPNLEAAVTEAEAGLASADAALERSATALREATILCPIDGIVLVRDKEVGDGVSSILTAGGNATQIMTLGDLSEMYIEARVDEVDLGRIQADMPALVTVDAYRGVELTGAVKRIAPAGSIDDNGIVTFEVEVSVDDPERILKPDMTAEVRMVIARQDAAPSLPQIALRPAPHLDSDEPGGPPRWVVERVVGSGESARIETVPVQVGLSDGLMTVITEGLSPGDRILMPIARRAGGR